MHAKVCIVDDVWMMVGSDNLNRRSWTHDSELSCAVIDETLDEREPRDPAGLGDGARRSRVTPGSELWREHLGRTESTGDDDLLEPDEQRSPSSGAPRRRSTAGTTAAAHGRAPARSRARASTRAGPGPSPLVGDAVSRVLNDPDGRPRADRRADRY